MAVSQHLTFAGTKTCYGEIPVNVLGGASVFTIEAEISTTSTANRTTYYTWGTIIGQELSGTWKDDFSLCVNDGKLCFWAQPKTGGSSSNYRVTSEAVVNDGEVHKVAVVSNADGSIDLHCDGNRVAHVDDVNAKITDTANLFIACNSNANSPLAFDLYELRLWKSARQSEEIFTKITGNEEGLSAWYIPNGNEILPDRTGNHDATLYGSPIFTQADFLPVTVKNDVTIKILNPARTWKYFNPGTADLLSSSGVTLENLPETQSKTGTAFYQTSQAKCFNLTSTTEIWIKFDVYFDGETRWRAYNEGYTGITAQTDGTLYFFSNDVEKYAAAAVCKAEKLQTVVLHMISHSADGLIEAWIDGEKIHSFAGNVNYGDVFSDIYLQSDGDGTFFSNVIISNVEIGLNETLYAVSATFDVVRNLKKAFSFTFDVARRVKGSIGVTLPLDVVVKDYLPLATRADIVKKVTKRAEFAADIAVYDAIPVSTAADVQRILAAKVSFMTTDAEIFPAESDVPVTISPDIKPKVADNPARLQSFEVSLAEQQISDTVKFTAAAPFYLLQQVRGQFLDYQYDFRVESIQQQGILYSCTCHTNIDKIFYTPLNYSLPSETVTKWHKQGDTYSGGNSSWKSESADVEFYIFPEASKHVEKIAQALNLQTVMRFKDFYSTVDFGASEENGGTYNDIIREVFGWSSRVPTEMINVYIRAGVLYVIQRGHEQHIIDISATKHSTPLFSWDLVRMFYKRHKWSTTETKQISFGRRSSWQNPDLSESESESESETETETEDEATEAEKNAAWLNVGSVVSDSSGTTETTHTYTDSGVLVRTVAVFTSNEDSDLNTVTTTLNDYEGNLLVKNTVTVNHADPSDDTRTVTSYGYIALPGGQTFLSTEQVTTFSRDEKGNWIAEDTRVTTKNPTGRGQGNVTDNRGNSSTGANIGDDRATPFLIDNYLGFYNDSGGTPYADYKSREIEGLTLFDTSFPIQDISGDDVDGADDAKGRGRLIELTEKIKRLNNKTRETVVLDLYEFPHLIDFNDRIILDGAEYFLSSNVLTTTPRVYNKQHLTLVRWF